MNAYANKPEAGEFWLARFVFEEGGSYKVRPVLIIEETPFGTKAAFCGTQKLDYTSARTDVLFDDDEANRMGLFKATRVCFSNRRMICKGDLLRKIGELGTPGKHLSVAKFREIAEAVQASGAI